MQQKPLRLLQVAGILIFRIIRTHRLDFFIPFSPIFHMAVRLAAEREIQGRKDYLAEYITLSVIEQFRTNGMLSKYPELHTSRNEK